MHVIITGGLGFIGSHLARHYLNLSHVAKVTSIENFSTNSIHDINHPSHKLIDIDLAFPSRNQIHQIETLISSCDLIYHCASSVGVRRYNSDPHSALANNSNINNVLFSLANKHKKKLVLTSTSEVYGETLNAKETDFLKIGPPTTPRWGYACSKLMSEFLLKSYSFPHVIARLFNITGPGQLSTHGMVMPTFIGRACQNKNLTIYGDGRQVRSFCDIRDAIAMLTMLGNDDKFNGEIFNVGNPHNTVSILELAQQIIQLSKSASSIHFKSFASEFGNHSADIIHRKVNTDKINRFYLPKFSLNDIITSMLRDSNENVDYLRSP